MNKPRGNKKPAKPCNLIWDLTQSNISSGNTCTFVLQPYILTRAFPVHISELYDRFVCRATVKCCHVKCQLWSFKIISGRSNYNFDFHDLFMVLRKTHTLHLIWCIHTLNSSDIFRFLQRNG